MVTWEFCRHNLDDIRTNELRQRPYGDQANNCMRVKMTFTAHLEYLFHITCANCKFYWTYASMQKQFDIEKGYFYCPKCGQKNRIELQGETGVSN